MDRADGYDTIKTFSRLPKHVSYACKRTDVDQALRELERDPPFHRLWFGAWRIPAAAQSPHLPDRIEIAEARESFHFNRTERDGFRAASRSLLVQLVPRSIVVQARRALVDDGLARLLQWLAERADLPETARGRNFAFRAYLDTKEGTVVYRESSAKVGSDP
ncbi:MAG: hypothetical protein AAGD14_01780 [Planctomycetota bacterium]